MLQVIMLKNQLTKFLGCLRVTTIPYARAHIYALLKISVAVRDPGSVAFLTPGSGIRNRFFPDPGSLIPDPNPIFLTA
jgi:hypothetical protein